MTLRVVLADDQPLIRAGLRLLIADTPDLALVGEAATGAQAVRLVRDFHPDVVVMDIRMPGMDGIEATRIITADAEAARILILTTFDDDDYVYAALRAGASGFLVKDTALDDILAGIRTVAAGDALIAPSVTRRLIEAVTGWQPGADQSADLAHPDQPAHPAQRGRFTRSVQAGRPAPELARPTRRLDGITEREREVLTLVGLGKSNSEIAAALFISIATAKAHVARLFVKLDARDRVQLVIVAYETGLVRPTGLPDARG